MFRLKAKFLVLFFKAILALITVMIPVLGVWFSSSLAAYFDGPIWLAGLIALLFFPVIPLLWDWWATVRWNRKQERKESEPEPVSVGVVDEEPEQRGRILTFWDRLILRTLVVNLALLVSLGWLFPQTGFTALSARGDWMLDRAEGEWAGPIREGLFATADGLEFLYQLAYDNPFDEYADEDGVVPEPGERGELPDRDTEEPTDEPEPDDEEPDPTEVDEEEEDDRPAISWPPPDELHPLAAEIPESKETSIESVADYIADNETDPYYRVKALYDYVADNVVYDVDALTGHRPPQDAQTVFETGKAVCAGYARLLIELGKHTGDEIVYVTGVSRDLEGEIGGGGHAWNAARIEGSWYLMDPTWGAGHVDDEFNPEYNPVYLFTPPEVLIKSHFPDDDRWQLLDEPLSRGEFVRQPVLRTAFYAEGLELLEPTRSQQRVGTEARVVIENPDERRLLANLVGEAGSEGRCDVTGGEKTVIECPLPSRGIWRVKLFAGDPEATSFPMVGQLEVQGG